MRCPNCGRENPGIRLFCSRCGELLPDADAQKPAEDLEAREADVRETDDDIKIYKRPEPAKPVPEKEPEPSDAPRVEETDFFTRRERVRRLYEDDWPELTARTEKDVRERVLDVEEPKPKRAESSPYARPTPESTRRVPTLNRKSAPGPGRPSTIVPRRDVSVDPENLFSVRGETPFDEDDFDRAPRGPARTVRQRSAYEEPESQSFFMRHVRGIVAMLLLVITATIVLTWAFTPNAQLVLARLDLAWSATAYGKLGYEAYHAGDFGNAGRYFNIALNRDDDNYDYAVGAANSFIQNGETGKAIAAVKRCIALKPDDADAYVRLIELYGGYENLPTDAKQIVDEGYELTGDARLKQ